MTFDRIHVEFYMTKFSFLTVFFFCVCERPKNALIASTWSNIQRILCCVYVSAKKARCLLKRNLNIVCAVFKRNLNVMC